MSKNVGFLYDVFLVTGIHSRAGGPAKNRVVDEKKRATREFLCRLQAKIGLLGLLSILLSIRFGEKMGLEGVPHTAMAMVGRPFPHWHERAGEERER